MIKQKIEGGRGCGEVAALVAVQYTGGECGKPGTGESSL